jgi:predicted esterase
MFRKLVLFAVLTWVAFTAGTCSHEELSLSAEVPSSYLVRLPADYDSTQDYPVVIALHGRDQDESQMIRLWDEGFFSDPNFILLAVRAPFKSKNGYAWISENAVNTTSDPDAVLRASARVADDRILEVLDDASDQYNVEDVEIYLLGFAQGATLAFYSAFKHPDVFAGVASESGNLDSILNPPRTLKAAKYLDIYLSVGRDEAPGNVAAVRRTGELFLKLDANIDLNVHDGGRALTWQSCRHMQNLFSLSNSDAPEDNFSGSPNAGGFPSDESDDGSE